MGNRAGGAHAVRQVEEEGLLNSAAFRSYEKIFAGSNAKKEGPLLLHLSKYVESDLYHFLNCSGKNVSKLKRIKANEFDF